MATSGELSDSASLKQHPSQQVRARRYEPTPVYALAEQLKREGVELHNLDGPWHPIRRSLRRPGRNAERAIPIVTNGFVDIAVDTAEHAADLSGLLNSVGLDHLDPVPNLRPPDQDLVRD
ncbi:MAG TPA: hypothetical protein VIG08_04915 [Gemmatimonadales bacterium]|jgi:hypothetical protein